MIALTFALPTESADFRKLLAARAIADDEVRVVHTGVGELASKRSIQQLLDAQSPRLLISSGFAGALTSELPVGAVLLAQNFTSPHWLDRSRAVLGESAHVGVLTTASGITDSANDRSALAARTSAIAVDMETAFIADACRAASVPIISLRVVSDTPAAPMPAPPHVLFDIEAQKTRLSVIALHLLKHPGAMPRLISFARQIATARERLTSALAVLVEDVRSAT
jgi:adenosylhomocysteine nucleosidase